MRCACNNVCCGSDAVGGCGCDDCDDSECWSDVDFGDDFGDDFDDDFDDDDGGGGVGNAFVADYEPVRLPFAARFACRALPERLSR